MVILSDYQFMIFSPGTIFKTFSYKSLAGFLFKVLQIRGGEVALDFCVWPLCAQEEFGKKNRKMKWAVRKGREGTLAPALTSRFAQRQRSESDTEPMHAIQAEV